MYFEIVGYNENDVRKVIISEVESIKEISMLFGVYEDLFTFNLLHPDIKRLKCYIIDHEKMLDVTESVSDGYNVYPRGD